MCVGVGAALGLVMSMATAGVQYSAAMDDYNAQSAAWRQNVTNAFAAARNEQGQLLLKHMQEQEATGQKVKLSMIEEAEKRALVEVSAAAGNVSGLSVDNLLADVTRRSAYNRQVERVNFTMKAAQLQSEQDATIIRAENRINSMPRPTKPNAAAFFLPALASGVRGFAG